MAGWVRLMQTDPANPLLSVEVKTVNQFKKIAFEQVPARPQPARPQPACPPARPLTSCRRTNQRADGPRCSPSPPHASMLV